MTMAMQKTLWAFACDFYGFAEVKQQCLQLQEHYMADVNVMLWLCWLATANVVPSPAALTEAQQAVGPINQNLLRPLRQLRKAALANAALTESERSIVREHLLTNELALEKLVLLRLQELTPQLPVAGQGGEGATLHHYLGSLHGLEPQQAYAAGQRLLACLSDYLALGKDRQ